MENKIAIIMCTWQRIENYERTLKLLSIQNRKDFDFFVWNNNKDISHDLKSISSNFSTSLNILIENSHENIGGFGRFKMASEIADKYDIIIFIDDDQIFNENMVNRFFTEYDNNSLKSRWAWRFNGVNYTNRTKINKAGVKVHYCGTGGMVIPAWVFKRKEIFEIPKEFLFIEDLWLSFVCDHFLKMDVISIEDNGFIKQIVDNKDQYKGLMNKKNIFMKYLITIKKWKLK